MRKTFLLSGAALCLAIVVLVAFLPSSVASAKDNDCFISMSDETSRYVREAKVPLRGNDAEFYSSETEQVLLLSSDEIVKLPVRKPITSTVAVIDHRGKDGIASFYVIEQVIAPGSVTFHLRKDSRILESLQVALTSPSKSARLKPEPVCGANDCAVINSNEAVIDAAMAALANQTCKRQLYCVEHCMCFAGKLAVAQTLKYVDPTSRRCWRVNVETRSLQMWNRVSAGPLLAHSFEVAVQKAVTLYRF